MHRDDSSETRRVASYRSHRYNKAVSIGIAEYRVPGHSGFRLQFQLLITVTALSYQESLLAMTFLAPSERCNYPPWSDLAVTVERTSLLYNADQDVVIVCLTKP